MAYRTPAGRRVLQQHPGERGAVEIFPRFFDDFRRPQLELAVRVLEETLRELFAVRIIAISGEGELLLVVGVVGRGFVGGDVTSYSLSDVVPWQQWLLMEAPVYFPSAWISHDTMRTHYMDATMQEE